MERRTFLKKTTASVCARAEMQFTSSKNVGASEALDVAENQEVPRSVSENWVKRRQGVG
jgi:hypothetical protein